jgi:hypothetical protein
VEFCTNGGARRADGAHFCGSCGRPFPDGLRSAPPEPRAGSEHVPDDTPFGGETRSWRSSEVRPRRRGFLKSWPIASTAWLCTGWIVVVFLVVGVSSSAGGCKGGIDRFSVPSSQSSDNVHWTATSSCIGGGTKTVPYHGKVP